MNAETIFTNAVLVLPDEALRGTLVMRGDTIAEIADRPFGVARRDRSRWRLSASGRCRRSHR